MRPRVPTGFCHRVEAEHADGAGLGLQHAEDVLDERRLAGAVAADQPEHAAARDGQRHVVERPSFSPNLRVSRRISTIGGVRSERMDLAASFMTISPRTRGGHAWPRGAARAASTTSSNAISICRASASSASIRSVRILSRSRRASGEPWSETYVPAVRRFSTTPAASSSRYARATVFGLMTKLLRQDANRRQLFAGRQPAGRDQVLDLVDDLQVDRHAVVGGNMNLHRTARPRQRHVVCINELIQ